MGVSAIGGVSTLRGAWVHLFCLSTTVAPINLNCAIPEVIEKSVITHGLRIP